MCVQTSIHPQRYKYTLQKVMVLPMQLEGQYIQKYIQENIYIDFHKLSNKKLMLEIHKLVVFESSFFHKKFKGLKS